MVGSIQLDKALNIDGWMLPTELRWLAEMASRSKVIFEIGTYKGRSTRALCDNTEGKVYSIDPYPGKYFTNDNEFQYYSDDRIIDELKVNLNDHFNSFKLTHFRTNLPEYVMWFHSYYLKPDFIFIDGDHRYNYVKADILAAQRILKEGGIISGHDYGYSDWPGVKKAVDEIFGEINTQDSIWYKQL